MASPTMQPRELHDEKQRSSPSEHSNKRPESVTSARSARSPPPGSKHRLSADGKVRSVEAAQAMEYLEAETGFASYAAYLESHPYYNHHFDSMVWLKYGLQHSDDANNHCAIIDLFKEEASPPKASLRHEELSAVQVLQSLRTPSNGVKVQVVFWSLDESSRRLLDPDFVTVLGLGLKLNPRFLQILADKLPGSVGESAVNERSLPEYLFVDSTIIAIARDCPLAKPGGPPVLLIVSYGGLDYHIDKNELHDLSWAAPSTRTAQFFPSDIGDIGLYIRLLTASMNQNPDCNNGEEALLFESLLPLLQLDIVRMRARCSCVRSRFQIQKRRVIEPILDEIMLPPITDPESEPTSDDTADSRLYRYRVFLRSISERFEGLTEPLMRFISSQLGPELTTSPAYQRFAEERGLLLKEVLSLEAEIRDFLQLQTGQLSLLESRKSIEVSNNQLQEGKRVKIFTILAFVYIPLNLATSIFGMNLQQLNGSGKSIKYFVLTALIALIITGGSWWLMEQWGSLRAWRNRDPYSYKGPTTFRSYARPTPNYSILVRAAMLTWLVARGHSSWMVRSGAGWCILINSRRERYGADSNEEPLFAGDYLSGSICPDYDETSYSLDHSGWWI